jgi:hypothetical protein
MPITNTASYLLTLDEFISHWAEVNAVLLARGDRELLLPDGCSVDALTRQRAEIAWALERLRTCEASEDPPDPVARRQLGRLRRGLARRLASACSQVMHRLMKYRSAVRFQLGLDPNLIARVPRRLPTSYVPGSFQQTT